VDDPNVDSVIEVVAIRHDDGRSEMSDRTRSSDNNNTAVNVVTPFAHLRSVSKYVLCPGSMVRCGYSSRWFIFGRINVGICVAGARLIVSKYWPSDSRHLTRVAAALCKDAAEAIIAQFGVSCSGMNWTVDAEVSTNTVRAYAA
jgi:hypothetical protein